jgi:hypothetical protein
MIKEAAIKQDLGLFFGSLPLSLSSHPDEIHPGHPNKYPLMRYNRHSIFSEQQGTNTRKQNPKRTFFFK